MQLNLKRRQFLMGAAGTLALSTLDAYRGSAFPLAYVGLSGSH